MYPPHCVGYDCAYVYTQQVTGAYVTIELLAEAAGWVAVGYGTMRGMVSGPVSGFMFAEMPVCGGLSEGWLLTCLHMSFAMSPSISRFIDCNQTFSSL